MKKTIARKDKDPDVVHLVEADVDFQTDPSGNHTVTLDVPVDGLTFTFALTPDEVEKYLPKIKLPL